MRMLALIAGAIAIGLGWVFLRRRDKNEDMTYLDVWNCEVTYFEDEALLVVRTDGPETGPRDDNDTD